MKWIARFFAAVLVCSFLTAACAVSCKSSRNGTLSEGENQTADNSNPQKPNTDDNKPAVPAGFIVPNGTGLVVYGVEDSYLLSEDLPYLCVNDLPLTVRTSKGGKEIPASHYKLELSKGDSPLPLSGRLRAGTYLLSCTLKDAVYPDGQKADGVSSETEITVTNPVKEFRFASGELRQAVSERDKISAGWVFEEVYSNGVKRDIYAGQLSLPALDTRTAGKHSITVVHKGIPCTVEYEISPAPTESLDFDITLKEGVSTQTEADSLTLGLDDFEFTVSPAEVAPVSAAFICGGKKSGQIEIPATGEAVPVTVEAMFEMEAEGETYSRAIYATAYVEVTKILPEPPESDTVIADGEVIAGLPEGFSGGLIAGNGKGEITLKEEAGVSVSAEGGVLRLDVDFGAADECRALCFSLKEGGTVTVTAQTDGFAAVGVESGGSYVYEPVFADTVPTDFSFALGAGEYSLLIIGTSLSVLSISITF